MGPAVHTAQNGLIEQKLPTWAMNVYIMGAWQQRL
jgi:hypothetical protein